MECDTPKALRRGGFLFAVETLTRGRQDVATDILVRHGAHTVSFGERTY